MIENMQRIGDVVVLTNVYQQYAGDGYEPAAQRRCGADETAENGGRARWP